MAQVESGLARRALVSGLIESADLTRCRAELGEETDDARVVEWLLKQGLLTKWQATQLEAGRTQNLVLNGYKLLAPLGAGGMGSVYRAFDTKSRCQVALKVLPPRQATPDAIGRFRREAFVALQMRHDHVVTSFELAQQGTIHFLVMELVDGRSLSAHLVKHGRLGVRETARIGRDVALALAHAHELGIIHRDIKPSNILLSREGHVKVADMGLAKFFGPQSRDGGPETSTGHFLGTIDYCSPEQAIDAKRADIRSDIYSLGCTLYRCLTGGPPFAEGTEVQRIMAHIELLPASIRLKNPDVPPAFAALMEKRMLAKDPGDRFQTPIEAAEALEPWIKGEGSSANAWAGLESLDGLIEAAAQAPRVGVPQGHRDTARWAKSPVTRRAVRLLAGSKKESILRRPLVWVGLVLLVLAGATAASLWWLSHDKAPAVAGRGSDDDQSAESAPAEEKDFERDREISDGEALALGTKTAGEDDTASQGPESTPAVPPPARTVNSELDAGRAAISDGDKQSARDHLQTALAIFEQRFDTGETDQAVTKRLTEALLDACSWWTVLHPSKLSSEGGSTLTLLADQSILVGGVNPPQDVYTIEARVWLQNIAALKVEVLPHETLPKRGPGRYASGNFHLTDVAAALGNDASSILRRLPLANASADYSQPGFEISQAIDANRSTAWGIFPKVGREHYAVFRFAAPARAVAGSWLRVTLAFQSVWDQAQAGRVRLFVGDRSDGLSPEEVRSAIAAGDVSPIGALGAALLAYGEEQSAQRWFARAANDADCDAIVHFLSSSIRHRQGDRVSARQLYDRGMAEVERRVEGEAAQFLARQAAIEVGGLAHGEAVAAILRAQDAAQLAVLTRAIEKTPDSKAYRARTQFFATRARWKEAAADWEKLLEPLATIDGLALAAILAAANDRAEYRAHCRRMLSRFENTQDGLQADQTAKACSLMPDAIADWKAVHKLSRLAVKLGTGWQPVVELDAALADYRAGDLLAARHRLRDVSPGNLGPEFLTLYHAVAALVSHRMKAKDQARHELEEATKLIHASVPDFARQVPFSHDWLIAEVIRREAAALIEGPTAAITEPVQSGQTK